MACLPWPQWRIHRRSFTSAEEPSHSHQTLIPRAYSECRAAAEASVKYNLLLNVTVKKTQSTSTQETYLSAKEPNKSAGERQRRRLYHEIVGSMSTEYNLHPRKNPTFLQKSHTHLQKNPTYPQESGKGGDCIIKSLAQCKWNSIHIHKKNLHICRRARHISKRALYIRVRP